MKNVWLPRLIWVFTMHTVHFLWFATLWLVFVFISESPCSSEERYITLDYGKCTRKTCKGRCENMTAYGKTDKQVCCISPDDLRVVGGSGKRFLFAFCGLCHLIVIIEWPPSKATDIRTPERRLVSLQFILMTSVQCPYYNWKRTLEKRTAIFVNVFIFFFSLTSLSSLFHS